MTMKFKNMKTFQQLIITTAKIYGPIITPGKVKAIDGIQDVDFDDSFRGKCPMRVPVFFTATAYRS